MVGARPLLFNALGHVARSRSRAARRPASLFLGEGEGHFDVKLASRLVRRAGQRWVSLQFHDSVCHGRLEAAPMSRPQVLGDDQIEILTEGLCGAVAKE